MMASKPIDVYVKLVTGRTTTFVLQSTDLVQKVYEQIASEESVAVEQIQIKYTGKVLNPQLTVGFTGICNETILKAEVMQILADWAFWYTYSSLQTSN